MESGRGKGSGEMSGIQFGHADFETILRYPRGTAEEAIGGMNPDLGRKASSRERHRVVMGTSLTMNTKNR